jgi:hypothetical protein
LAVSRDLIWKELFKGIGREAINGICWYFRGSKEGSVEGNQLLR